MNVDIQISDDFNCPWNLYLWCELRQILKPSTLWKFDSLALVVNFSLESYSNLMLKLVSAIHFYSCTMSMLSSSWINVLKEETLHCQNDV